MGLSTMRNNVQVISGSASRIMRPAPRACMIRPVSNRFGFICRLSWTPDWIRVDIARARRIHGRGFLLNESLT